MEKFKAFVARDKSGHLGLYLFNQPQLKNGKWEHFLTPTECFCKLPEIICQNVTFENSPVEIEIDLP